MKTLVHLCLMVAVCCCGCSNASGVEGNSSDSMDTLSQNLSVAEQGLLPDNLLPFKCVVDTLNSACNRVVNSEYFLHDITGDGQPELWVKSGSCEANMDLWVYTNDNGAVRKILSTYGGHTDFFLKGDVIGSVTCNTGSGYVSIYRYNNGRLEVQTANFSTWNDDGEAKALKRNELAIIEIRENSDSDIQFNPLK